MVWYLGNSFEPPSVDVVVATEQSIHTTFTADGVVKGITVSVSSRVAARIESIAVNEGDSVKSGQLLVTLADDEIQANIKMALSSVRLARSAHNQSLVATRTAEEQAQSAIRTAQAQFKSAMARLAQAKAGNRPQEIELARHQLEAARAAHLEAKHAAERARKLYEGGAVSLAAYEAAATREAVAKEEFESAQDAYELVKAGPRAEAVAAAEEEVKVAHAAVAQAESGRREVDVLRAATLVAAARVAEAQSALRRIQSDLGDLNLASPTTGVISKRRLEPGDLASPGMPILEVVDSRGKYIEGEVSDEDIGKANVDDKVTVSTAAYPGRNFPATITQVAPSAELKPDVAVRTRIVRFRVKLDGPYTGFKVGMEVDIEGRSTSTLSSLTVPADALVFSGNETAVWIFESGKVRLASVKTGVTTPTLVEILSGLKAGDQVVVTGKEALTEGQTVRLGAK